MERESSWFLAILFTADLLNVCRSIFVLNISGWPWHLAIASDGRDSRIICLKTHLHFYFRAKRPAILKYNHLRDCSLEKNDQVARLQKVDQFFYIPLNKSDQLKIIIPFFCALMKTKMAWGIFVPSFT